MVVAQKKPARRTADVTAESLSDELRLLRSDAQALAKRLSKDLAASRQEIRRLAQRVQALERAVQPPAQAGMPAVAAQLVSQASQSLFTFLGRPQPPTTPSSWSPSVRPKHSSAH